MFVTGLEFLPVNSQQQNHTVRSVAEAAVLSISVDNQVCIHTLPYRSNVNITLKKTSNNYNFCFRNNSTLAGYSGIDFNHVFDLFYLLIYRIIRYMGRFICIGNNY